jgi:hypothetical protein
VACTRGKCWLAGGGGGRVELMRGAMRRRLTVAGAIALGLFLVAGCASDPKNAYATVLAGMSRNNLRFYFGEPLRIEPAAAGGEDWYYRFASLHVEPTGASGASEEFGQQTSYASASLDFSRQVVELPVHVSSEGFVVEPLPKGKVVKN